MPIYWKSLYGFWRQETVVCKNKTFLQVHFCCCCHHTVCELFFLFSQRFFFFNHPTTKIILLYRGPVWKQWTNFSSFLLLLLLLLIVILELCLSSAVGWFVVWTLLSKKFLIQKGWIYKSVIYSVIPFHCYWLFYHSLFLIVHSSSLSGRVAALNILKWSRNLFFCEIVKQQMNQKSFLTAITTWVKRATASHSKSGFGGLVIVYLFAISTALHSACVLLVRVASTYQVLNSASS